jgi:hypothetical protein
LLETLVRIGEAALDSGAIGYLVCGSLLLFVSGWAFGSKNRVNRTAYVFGWLVAVLLINLYFAGDGDQFLRTVIGEKPREELYMPAFFGLVLGFLLVMPFNRPGANTAPSVLAIVTAGCLLMLFLSWRILIPDPAMQVEIIINYRRRFMGIFALMFAVGLLIHLLTIRQQGEQAAA